jgi:hypothetical protein
VSDSGYRPQGWSILRQKSLPTVYCASFFDDVSRGMRIGTEKYIYFPSDGRLLYTDLANDPAEEHDRLMAPSSRRKRIIGQFKAFSAYQHAIFEGTAPEGPADSTPPSSPVAAAKTMGGEMRVMQR